MIEEIVAHILPKSPVAESFRTLRTNIQFTGVDKKVRTILLTSCYPGEGKSWVSSNLAVTFAQTGKRVLIIDADMRRGRQDEIFRVKDRPGLSNILSGINEFAMEENKENVGYAGYIEQTEVPNLSVMPVGNVPPNPSELLSSGKMGDLLERLKFDFDVILLDGTPSAIVSDSIILSRIVDSVVIVTAVKKTQREDVLKLKKAIENVGGKIGGIVLNKMPANGKEYAYQYYSNVDLSVKRKSILHSNKNKKERVVKNKGAGGEFKLVKKETEQEQANLFDASGNGLKGKITMKESKKKVIY